MKSSELVNLKQWDTEFFGYKVGTIYYEHIKHLKIEDILNSLQLSDYKLIYLIGNKISKRDKRLFLDLSDFHEEKIILQKKIKNNFAFNSTKDIRVAESGVVNTDLLSLAYQSGFYSRFRLDPEFKSGEFSKLYKTWIERSVKGELADAVYVYYGGMKYQGLITLAITHQNQCVNIGLISVLEEVRGKKIGSQLLHIAEAYARENNISKIQVATQAINTQAIKFYEKNYFKIVERTDIFHLRPNNCK